MVHVGFGGGELQRVEIRFDFNGPKPIIKYLYIRQ